MFIWSQRWAVVMFCIGCNLLNSGAVRRMAPCQWEWCVWGKCTYVRVVDVIMTRDWFGPLSMSVVWTLLKVEAIFSRPQTVLFLSSIHTLFVQVLIPSFRAVFDWCKACYWNPSCVRSEPAWWTDVWPQALTVVASRATQTRSYFDKICSRFKAETSVWVWLYPHWSQRHIERKKSQILPGVFG